MFINRRDYRANGGTKSVRTLKKQPEAEEKNDEAGRFAEPRYCTLRLTGFIFLFVDKTLHNQKPHNHL